MPRLTNENVPFSTNYLLNEYFKTVNCKQKLSKDEENELLDRIRKGDKKAKDKLIRMNLRFVILIVKQYQNRGLSLEDLINEGNVGLIKAIERFDKKRDCKFISYAVWWIRQTVLQAISEHSHVVRLPLNKINILNKCIKARAKITQEYRRNVTIDEISNVVDFNSKSIKKIFNIYRQPFYVDEQKNDDPNSDSVLDTLTDENSVDIANNVSRVNFKRDLKSFCDILNKKESYIIKSCYCYDSPNAALTLKEVSDKMGIPLQRIKQIVKRAFMKIKSSPRAYILKRYINSNIQENNLD